jgi:hypothetical protein
LAALLTIPPESLTSAVIFRLGFVRVIVEPRREIPMRIAKTMLASAAALGLIAAPISAQAAPARGATPTAQSEDIAGGGAILYIAAAAFAIALIVLVSSDDEDKLPASP